MAQHRHKRDTDARRKPRAVVVAGPLAVLLTASAVGVGVLVSDPRAAEVISATDVSASVTEATDVPETAAVAPRPQALSRGGSRFEIRPLTTLEKMMAPAAVRSAVRAADTRLWATEDLNLWTQPGDAARKVGVLDAGTRVLATGRELLGRAEVVIDGTARWVTLDYLTAEKPKPESEETAAREVAGVGGSCTNGSSVPSGVSPNVVAVHEAVCAAFPELTSYGTFRGDGEHAQGIAIDIMVSGDRGWEVAEFVRANHAELGVSYLIYAQKIWSVERGSEGWRDMEDRGSVTANHYDHVHVTTY